MPEFSNAPDYRTWMYFRDPETHLMDAQIVGGKGAVDLFEKGWRTSPAEFPTEKEKFTETDTLVIEDMAMVLNTLLNLDKIESRKALVEFGEKFLKMNTFNAKMNVATVRKRIIEKARKEGLYDDDK